MGTQHQNDVVSTSMRRDHVASTLIRRHFNVVCPLGGDIRIFFLLHKNIYFGYSLEALLWDTSNQYPQHTCCEDIRKQMSIFWLEKSILFDAVEYHIILVST